MAAKFELYKDKAGEFRFRLKGDDGVMLSSEGYAARSSAENGIASVKKNAADAKRFDTRQSSSGKPYFVLKSGNGQIIAQSGMCDSAAECDSLIAAVAAGAPGAAVDDQT